MTKIIKIATRASKLALIQAQIVAKKLEEKFSNLKTELVPLTTKGDQILNSPLSKIGGKGLFIKELENALLEKKADIAVHSMKDVSSTLEDEFVIGAILERERAEDAFISNEFFSFNELPKNAVVGTSSLRRKMQILNLRPDLEVLDLRGNLQTRLEKLDKGDYSAIILAAAGLKRLGLMGRIRELLPTEQFLPAVGQGAIGIECLKDCQFLEELKALNDEKTELCVKAERIISQKLNGSCQIPLAAFAEIQGDLIRLRAKIASTDNKIIFKAADYGHLDTWDYLAQKVAEELKEQLKDKQ